METDTERVREARTMATSRMVRASKSERPGRLHRSAAGTSWAGPTMASRTP